MGWTPTLIIAGAALAITVVAAWRGARKPDPSRPPRLIPWRMVMVSSAAVLLYMLAHMVNLGGVTTGR